MATLQQIGDALKKAGAAGNVDDAKRLAAAYRAEQLRQGVGMSGAAAPVPQTGPMDFLTQGLSGLNDGIAQGLGAPVDLATDAINLGTGGANALFHTSIPQITNPMGGSGTFRTLLSPTIKPATNDKSLQVTRRIMQELGAWAVPGGGIVAKAERPMAALGREVVGALGSGTGAAVAQQIAPGNPLAEMAGQLAGAMTPSGAARMMERKPALPPAPSIDQLREAKNAAYQQADAAGVRYSSTAFQNVVGKMIRSALGDHISDARHPAAVSMLQDLAAKADAGAEPTMTALDQMRQVIRRDLVTPAISNPAMAADAHFGGQMIDHIDNLIENPTSKDVVSGDAQAGAKAMLSARSLNTRLRKSEMLDDAMQKAQRQAASSGSGGNINNAVRQQIKMILNNPRKASAFTAAERQQMDALIRQDSTENLLRWLGKAAPGGNGLIGVLEVLGTLHNPATAALPVAGMVAKGIADRGTLTKMGQLQARVAAGAPPPAIPRAPMPLPSAALLYAQAANQQRPLQITVNGGAR